MGGTGTSMSKSGINRGTESTQQMGTAVHGSPQAGKGRFRADQLCAFNKLMLTAGAASPLFPAACTGPGPEGHDLRKRVERHIELSFFTRRCYTHRTWEVKNHLFLFQGHRFISGKCLRYKWAKCGHTKKKKAPKYTIREGQLSWGLLRGLPCVFKVSFIF